MSSPHHRPEEEEPDLHTVENSIPTRSKYRADDFRAIDLDLFSHRHDHLFCNNSDSDYNSEWNDEMNFVTDLFASREAEYLSDDQDSDFRSGFSMPVSEFTESFINGGNFFEGYNSNPGEGLGFGSPTGIGNVHSTSQSSEYFIEDGNFRVFLGSDVYGWNDGEELGSEFGSPIGGGSVAHVSELSDSSTVDVGLGGFEGFGGYDSNDGEDLGFGFESPIGISSPGITSESRDSLASSRDNLSTDGLLVVGIESDSDSEEVARDENNGEPFADLNIPFWDCLGLEEPSASRTEEFVWVEVDQRVDERNSLSSVIGSFEELSISSEILSSDEGIHGSGRELLRSLQRELLSVFNMGRTHDSDHDVDIDGAAYLRDGYAYEAEYDTVFLHSVSAAYGNPPASKSVRENLPCLVLRKEDFQENYVVCAVCKDEAVVGEKLTRLPCFHLYHRDCIVPWLCIRNTCPVCRYALPTDDLDYEKRQIQREDFDLRQDLQVVMTGLANGS